MNPFRIIPTVVIMSMAFPLALLSGCGKGETRESLSKAASSPSITPISTSLAATPEQPALFTVRVMAPELALKAVQAALKSCRDAGFQVAVAVVDRSGVVQSLMRDRFAGPHTPDTARGKAWTAITFRSDTKDLVEPTQNGPQSGARFIPGTVMIGGGVRIEAAGSTVGAIGVSGTPSGAEDDACARAGVKAIEDALNF